MFEVKLTVVEMNVDNDPKWCAYYIFGLLFIILTGILQHIDSFIVL